MHVESYKHRYAKETLATWFNEIEKYNNPINKLDIYSWKGAVIMEYPIMYRYLESGKVEYLGVNPCWSTLPDIKKLEENKFKVCCIIDVAVMDSGKLKYAFEIEHKHATEDSKISLLTDLGVETYEISADWVLNQVRRPKKLQYTLLKTGVAKKLINYDNNNDCIN